MLETEIMYSFENQFSDGVSFIINDNNSLSSAAKNLWELHKLMAIDFIVEPFAFSPYDPYNFASIVNRFSAYLGRIGKRFRLVKYEFKSRSTKYNYILGNNGTLAVITPQTCNSKNCYDNYAEFINDHGEETVRRGTALNMLYPLEHETRKGMVQYHPIITHMSLFNIYHIINFWEKRMPISTDIENQMRIREIALWKNQLDVILSYLKDKKATFVT